MTGFRITCRHERFALKEPFVISRGTKTHADVVVATIEDESGCRGVGEAVPYARYGETLQDTVSAISHYSGPFARSELLQAMAPGAARNALDCALVDLEAKRHRQPAAAVVGAGRAALGEVETAYTLSLGTPGAMAKAARAVPHLKLLKLKLGGRGDDERLKAVRFARPDARLIADANEAWTDELLVPLMSAAAAVGVELIEQPLPAGADETLAKLQRPVPVCADESAHTSGDLDGLGDRYDAINIKLDKAGGLTEALRMLARAKSLGLEVMVGSMVASSLAVAPALILAQEAKWVDLDGPLLLSQDRPNGLEIRNGWIAPASSLLWG